MEKSIYEAYLQTGHWRRWRAAELIRANHACERCASRHLQLHVHHLHYRSLGFEQVGDTQVVCRDCHQYLHGYSSVDPARVPTLDELITAVKGWRF